MSIHVQKKISLMKLLRRIVIVFFFAFVGLNIYLAVTGKWYFYSALSKTYFSGQKGPGIYDLNHFPYRTIESDDEVFQLIEHRYTSPDLLTTEELAYLKKLKTTSFLVMRNDTILYEYYFDKHDSLTVSNTFSAAKSVIGLLIGIAIEEGFIDSLDQAAGDYIPEFDTPELRPITIRHLLTMSPGLDWHESGGNPFSDNAEAYYGKDLRAKVVKQKPIRKSGEVFDYISSSTQLLTQIIEKATSQHVSSYMEKKIWSKIGTEHKAFWSLDREDGVEKGYCCLYATTRDFARIGYLILNNGRYKNEQIVPEWYMKESFTPAKLKTLSGQENQRYGLHWWLLPSKKDTIVYARGIQGQYITVIPSKNLIFVRTGHTRAENYEEIPSYANDYPALIRPQAGHPSDLFIYLGLTLQISDKLR
jgi:CubicO group peptidase (beta-lactamase class C family)